ncbi:MAG: sulfotransferase [Chlamydiota bacterium]
MKSQKPNFLIIGAAKCGTTALSCILATHPDCCMSRPKEMDFFQDTVDFEPNQNYEKGWEWYQKAFEHYAGEPIVGEASPAYSDRSRCPDTAKRIHKFNPDMKIVYMVRDPLQRQISYWKMQYAFGREKSFLWRREYQWALKGFDYWMQKQREVNQWDECRYGYQLAAYQALFPSENICVSFLEDWTQCKEVEVKRIMRFLGLDPELWSKDAQENENRGVDRTIDRPWLLKIRTHPFIQFGVKKFPLSWRSWARVSLGRTKVNIPAVEISKDVEADFLDHVIQDTYDFLEQNSKKMSTWKSVERKDLIVRT